MSFLWKTVLTGGVTLLGVASVVAQGLVMQSFPEGKPTIGLTYQRPEFTTSRGVKALSGAAELSVTYPISDNYVVSGYLPVGFFSTVDRSHAVLGNVGLSFGRGWRLGERTAMMTSLVTSLKTSPADHDDCACGDNEFASFVGWYADPYRAQRFTQQFWMFGFNQQGQHRVHDLVTAGFELFPVWFIPSSSTAHGSMFLNFGLQTRAGTGRFRGILEYVAMYWVAGDDPHDPYIYQDLVGLGARVELERARLTAYYQFALDQQISKTINGTYGLRLEFIMGEIEPTD